MHDDCLLHLGNNGESHVQVLHLREGHSRKRICFCHHQWKVYIELSYSPKFQLLKCILSQEICLQRSLKFGIDSRHFETNALRPGRARPLSVTSSCSQDFVLASVFVYSRSWLIFNLTVLSQRRVPNPEGSESENEEVNDRLEGTFWCSCERCQIM